MTLYPPNELKRRLASRQPALGFWLSMNSLAGTEIAAGAGFDWVLLDMEHAVHDIETVERHLLAAHHAGSSTEFVVRVPSLDVTLVKRLLDCGVRSFMFPNVQTVEEARLAVASTRYPPKGIRGVSGITRAARYLRDTEYFATYEAELFVVIQLETQAALETIAAFGAVDGIDAMLIGPNDLSASMGHLGQMGHPDALAAIDAARDAINATPAAAGILDFDNESARRRLERGFSMVAIAGDSTMLVRGMRDVLGKLR